MGVVWTTLLGENSVRFERGLQSKQKNSNIDSLIKRALVALSAAGGDDAHGINNNMPFPPLPPAVNISSHLPIISLPLFTLLELQYLDDW